MELDPESDSSVEFHPTERSEFFENGALSEREGLDEELVKEELRYEELHQKAATEALEGRIAAQADVSVEEDVPSSPDDDEFDQTGQAKKPKRIPKLPVRKIPSGQPGGPAKLVPVFRAFRDRYKRGKQRLKLPGNRADGFAESILTSPSNSEDSADEHAERLRRMMQATRKHAMSYAEREWMNAYMTLIHQADPHNMRAMTYMPLRAQETGGTEPYFVESRWYEDLSQYSIFQHSIFAYWPPKFQPHRFEYYRCLETRLVDTPNPFEENLAFNTSTSIAIPSKITRGSQVVFEAPEGLDLLFYGQELFTRAKPPTSALAIHDSDDEKEQPIVRSLVPERGHCPDLDVRRIGIVDDAYGGSASLGGKTGSYYAPEITEEDLELLREFEAGDRKKGKIVNMPEPTTLLERTIKEALPAAYEAFNITPIIDPDSTESLGEYAVLMESAHVLIQDMWQKLVDHYTRVERQKRRVARQQSKPATPPSSPLPPNDEVVQQLTSNSPLQSPAKHVSESKESAKHSDAQASDSSSKSNASKHSDSDVEVVEPSPSGVDQLPSDFGADVEDSNSPNATDSDRSSKSSRPSSVPSSPRSAPSSPVPTASSPVPSSPIPSSPPPKSPVQTEPIEVEKMATDGEKAYDIDDQAPDTSFMVTDAEEAAHVATHAPNDPWGQSALAQAPEEDENVWLQRLTSVISDSYWPLTVPVGKNETLIVNETVHSLQATEGLDLDSWVGQGDYFGHMDAVPFGIDTIQPIEQMDANESGPDVVWVNTASYNLTRFKPTPPPTPELPLFELSDLRPLSRPFTVSRITHELAVSDLIEWLDEMLSGLLKHAAAVNVDRRVEMPSQFHMGLYTRTYHIILDELLGVEHDRELRVLINRKIRLIYENYDFQLLWPTGGRDSFSNFGPLHNLHPLQQLVDAKYGRVGAHGWRPASRTDPTKLRMTRRAKEALMRQSDSEGDSERTHARHGRIKVDYDMIVNSFHRNHANNRRNIAAKIAARAEQFRADPTNAVSSPPRAPVRPVWGAKKRELLRAQQLLEGDEEGGHKTPTNVSDDEEIRNILNGGEDPTTLPLQLPLSPLPISPEPNVPKKRGRKPMIGPKMKPKDSSTKKKPGRRPKVTDVLSEGEEGFQLTRVFKRRLPKPIDGDQADILHAKLPRRAGPKRGAAAAPGAGIGGKGPGIGGKAVPAGKRLPRRPPKRKSVAPVEDDPDFNEDGPPSPKRILPKRTRTVLVGQDPLPTPKRKSPKRTAAPQEEEEEPSRPSISARIARAFSKRAPFIPSSKPNFDQNM